jgi:hypothetical protein
VPSTRANRCWILAYFVSWAALAGGACTLLAAVAWDISDGRVIDDDAALLGIPTGIVLGCLAARSTLGRRRVHGALVGIGLLVAVSGTAGAWQMFAAAAAQPVLGPFAGLGEVMVGVALLGLAALGVVCFAAGSTGRLAARTATAAREQPEIHGS